MAPPDGSDRVGPTELLVIEFPSGHVRMEGVATVRDLVERDVIGVLDLRFVRRTEGGSVAPVSIADAVAGDHEDLSALGWDATGLIGVQDLEIVGASIAEGSLAGVFLLEHTWVLPMIDRIASSGARVVRSVRVDPAEIVAARHRLEAEAP
ncbi:hypothetical protein GA707_04690 [Nostocoides sp. F2B08]|uniref:DUF6325 family protein n=1 Tax=Nostocoides sp. F2B08 TaxID=2653936 RepID=UPI001263BF9B|nr:DUF6325 family protein [Tetrasphaera sp. F2B08]KAB7745249.1 hypothetical protein GA707_04690 [Tetrasphaera sp. F2B08]